MNKAKKSSVGMRVGERGICLMILLLCGILFLTDTSFGAKIMAWGRNFDHLGNYAGQTEPPTGNDSIAISAGASHGLALRADGSIVGWGSNLDESGNYAGQSLSPEGNDFIAISAGYWHSLALRADGSITAWGYNLSGQAIPPEGNGFVAIAAGSGHSVALRADGSIVAWGDNMWGETDVPKGNDYVAISGGGDHNLALRADGSIVAWGLNHWGQSSPPAGNDFIAIAAGNAHSLALRSDGSIVGWGCDVNGRATPPAGNDFVAIAAGEEHSLALRADGSVVGWGVNNHGQATPPVGNDFTSISGGVSFSLALQKVEPIPTICYTPLISDLNQDCSVNLLDLAILSEEWMKNEPAMLIARFKLKANPNWLTQGQWEYGVPTGNGGTKGGNPDPTAGYTGTNVYGVNLSGDYTLVTGPAYTLTTGPISCVDFPGVTLKFARWLNTDAPEYVSCKVEASNDNATWETVWSNPTAIEDNVWTLVEYDISNVAGSQSSVFLRWTYQVLSARALPYSGWNIDDIEILGNKTP